MGRKSDAELLAELKQEVQIARHFRERFRPDWVYWELVYNDMLWGGKEKSSGRRRSTKDDKGCISQVNELETIVLTIIPDILFGEPVFEFTPSHPLWEWSAAVWELFATHLYRIVGLDETLEECVVDTLITGSGFHKAGYSYEVLSTGYQLNDATVTAPEIRNDLVFSDDISPMNLLIDYRVKAFRDCRWYSHEVTKPLEEVKRDKLYRNTTDLKGTSSSVAAIQAKAVQRGQQYKNKRSDLVDLHEYHDLENGKIYTFSEGHPKFLRKDNDYGIPIVDILRFSPSRPRVPYGKSIAQSIEEHAITIAKELYYMNEHMRRGGVSRWMYDKGRVDANTVKKMKSPNDFEMLGVDSLAGEPPIQEIKAASVNMEWFTSFQLHEAIIRMLSGTPMQSRGRHEPGVETAYEAAKLDAAGDRRNRMRLKKLDSFIAKIMEKLLHIVSDTWPRERILDTIGIPRELSFKLMPFDKIRVGVKFGSTALQARDEELKKVSMLAQILGNAGIQINPEGFVEVVSNAIGLDPRQTQLLLQQAPQSGQPSAGGEGGSPMKEGSTLSQILGQVGGG